MSNSEISFSYLQISEFLINHKRMLFDLKIPTSKKKNNNNEYWECS